VLLRTWIRIASIVLTVVAISQPALGQGGSSPEHDVLTAERQFNDARVARDIAALERLLVDDWTVTHGDGSIDTKAKYLADLKSRARTLEYVHDEGASVRFYGDTAVVAGLTDSKGQYNGQPSGGKLRFTRVYVRREGRWMMIVSHATRRP
jgi:ketosteroid isomerase-like protein